MGLAEIAFEHLTKLPEPLVREVLDFIEYLEHKQNNSINMLMQGQQKTLEKIWDNEEDEVWNDYKSG